MRNDRFIEDCIVDAGVFSESIEIFTNGELSFNKFYMDRLCQDGGEWERYGNNPTGMIYHAVEMTRMRHSYGEVINRVREGVKSLFTLENRPIAVSGGQRKDWLFSGPIAATEGVPHISINKNGTFEVLHPNGDIEKLTHLQGYSVVHVVDLITEGSSIYRTEGNIHKGWIPTLRRMEAEVKHVVAVVSRQQGGEVNLAGRGVIVHPFVGVNEEFLRKIAKNPVKAVAYWRDPSEFNHNYLKEHGALELISYFNPKNEKLGRAKKFLQRYEDVLKRYHHWDELENAVKQFGISNLQDLPQSF